MRCGQCLTFRSGLLFPTSIAAMLLKLSLWVLLFWPFLLKKRRISHNKRNKGIIECGVASVWLLEMTFFSQVIVSIFASKKFKLWKQKEGVVCTKRFKLKAQGGNDQACRQQTSGDDFRASSQLHGEDGENKGDVSAWSHREASHPERFYVISRSLRWRGKTVYFPKFRRTCTCMPPFGLQIFQWNPAYQHILGKTQKKQEVDFLSDKMQRRPGNVTYF